MITDIFRLIIQKIFSDKILLGLVAIGVLAVFMTGTHSGEEPPIEPSRHSAVEKEPEPVKAEASKKSEQKRAMPAHTKPKQPDTQKAIDFVKWWIGGAFDYDAQHAQKNHEAAFGWMTPEAAEQFKAHFWSPGISHGVATGQIVAAFHPVAVRAHAINPDGTVVISVDGTLVMQTHGQPSTQHIVTDYLVKEEADGMRIAGLFHRAYTQAASGSIY